MFTSSIDHVIPLPRTVEPRAGASFTLSADTVIVVATADDQARWIAAYLADVIGLAAAPQPPRVEASGGSIPAGAIVLELSGPANPSSPNGGTGIESHEGYEMTVTPERVTIRAQQPAGLFYGVQSFRQLLPPFTEYQAVRPNKARPVTAPAVRIVDEPRFGWRGAMLDVSRHFFPVSAVKRYIDLMSLYKLNRLHLHLADDQGWRIEIKSWPNLAAHGGQTQVGGEPAGSTPRNSMLTSSATRRSASSRSCRRSTCRAIPMPHWRRMPS
jgi:hexosaminidase